MPRYDESQARAAVDQADSYTAALRILGMRPNGGNHRLFRRYVDEIWRIPTDHFDSTATQDRGLQHRLMPLDDILVERSGYSRKRLNQRLYQAGLKERRCEMCGQGETWRGAQMALIIDHINGVPDDNRLENLRIVCPNCAARLDTHCGRKNRVPAEPRECAVCGIEFLPKTGRQRHCSRRCGTAHRNRLTGPRPADRKVQRPPLTKLLDEIERLGFSAVGRKYGVSDDAVRKWIRWYQVDAQGRNERGQTA